MLVPEQNSFLGHGELAKRVIMENISASIEDDELWLIKIKVHINGLNKSKILWVGGGAFDLNAFFDGIFALVVLREYLTIIAVYYVYLLIYD